LTLRDDKRHKGHNGQALPSYPVRSVDVRQRFRGDGCVLYVSPRRAPVTVAVANSELQMIPNS